ncbi:hypothetical protein H4R35_003863 [Dimargaris xerosporica]|nr:hypothetical protein H4R35_003863 [Dimargaris xerosporica]
MLPRPTSVRPAEQVRRDVVASSITVVALYVLTVALGTVVKEWYALDQLLSPVKPVEGPVPIGPLATDTLGQPLAFQVLGYLANKRNLLNRVFAKWSWGWTSAVFLLYAWRVIGQRQRVGPAVRCGLRWVLATAYWYLLTQWAFGPSLFDRVFTSSGGYCTVERSAVRTYHGCRVAGGQWQGGHDVSGHCMLLVHASLFLWTELSPYLLDARAYSVLHRTWLQRLCAYACYAILALWYTLLVCTALFFHSVREKATGTLFGLLYWWMAYGLLFPRTMYPGQPETQLGSVAEADTKRD